MKKLDIKVLLNAIAAQDGIIDPSAEESGPMSPGVQPTWNGDITRENIPDLFGLGDSVPGEVNAAWLKWIFALFGLGGPGDKACMRKLLQNQWFKLLKDFWIKNHSNHTPEGIAATGLQGAQWAYRLAKDMAAAGCFKGYKLYEILEQLLNLNERGKNIIRQGVKAAGQNIDKIKDAVGAALATKGPEYSQVYATAVSLESIAVGGTCSINISTGDVAAGIAIIAVIAAAFFVAGPLGAAAATGIITLLSSCGVANADQLESIRDRALQLNDRYLEMAGDGALVSDEEYIDTTVDPTGLSDSEDFDEDGNLK